MCFLVSALYVDYVPRMYTSYKFGMIMLLIFIFLISKIDVIMFDWKKMQEYIFIKCDSCYTLTKLKKLLFC